MKSLMSNKAGKLKTSTINTAILVIILIVIIFQVYASVVPEAQTAGDNLNDTNRCNDVGCFYNVSEDADTPCRNTTGNVTSACTAGSQTIPLAGLFSGTGVVFLIVMAALLILIVFSLMKPQKKK